MLHRSADPTSIALACAKLHAMFQTGFDFLFAATGSHSSCMDSQEPAAADSSAADAAAAIAAGPCMPQGGGE